MYWCVWCGVVCVELMRMNPTFSREDVQYFQGKPGKAPPEFNIGEPSSPEQERKREARRKSDANAMNANRFPSSSPARTTTDEDKDVEDEVWHKINAKIAHIVEKVEEEKGWAAKARVAKGYVERLRQAVIYNREKKNFSACRQLQGMIDKTCEQLADYLIDKDISERPKTGRRTARCVFASGLWIVCVHYEKCDLE